MSGVQTGPEAIQFTRISFPSIVTARSLNMNTNDEAGKDMIKSTEPLRNQQMQL